jgi:hypothetical protein
MSEQLLIAHVLHRAEELGVGAAKIHLVLFETARNRAWRVLGTGELNEERMSEHPEPAQGLRRGDTGLSRGVDGAYFARRDGGCLEQRPA